MPISKPNTLKVGVSCRKEMFLRGKRKDQIALEYKRRNVSNLVRIGIFPLQKIVRLKKKGEKKEDKEEKCKIDRSIPF